MTPERGFTLRRIEKGVRMALAPCRGVGLLVQVEGTGCFEDLDGGPVPLGAGEALLRGAARAARYVMGGPGARAVDVCFQHGFLREVAGLELGILSAPLRPDHGRMSSDQVLARLTDGMAEVADDGDAATLALVARALAARLLGRHVLAGRGRSADARLRAVLAHVEAQLETELRLGALAEIAGVSVFHFARRFRREMGMPVKAYVRARRVARAVRLIEQGALPLAEIAFACGFAHQSHLTAVFRRQTGHTPGQFRALVQRNAGRSGGG